MKAQMEIRRLDDGTGWQCLLNGLDIAPAVSNMTLHLSGEGGILSVNGRPWAIIDMQVPQGIVLGWMDAELDDATTAALKALGWTAPERVA